MAYRECEGEKYYSTMKQREETWWLNIIIIYLLRSPQQKLQTHRSLEAYCITLWWRWWGVFCFSSLMEHRWNEIDRGETCPSATLSTTNPTWTDPGSNPGLRGKRPATNQLSHDTALVLIIAGLHSLGNAWRGNPDNIIISDNLVFFI
jgi:hypothetical protein